MNDFKPSTNNDTEILSSVLFNKIIKRQLLTSVCELFMFLWWFIQILTDLLSTKWYLLLSNVLLFWIFVDLNTLSNGLQNISSA